MLKFALGPESIELSHSFVLTHCLQVAHFFASKKFKSEVAPNRTRFRVHVKFTLSLKLGTWSASAKLSLIFQLCFYVANAHLAAHFIPILVSKLVY